MSIIFWVLYYIVPGIYAWKKRTQELAKCVYSLFGTMFAVYLAIWCENMIHKNLGHLITLPAAKLWLTTITSVVIWLIVSVAFRYAVNKLSPAGLAIFDFNEKVCKFLVPMLVFLHYGLICAMLFTIFSVSPAARYVNSVSLNKSLCSGARYRMLWNTFLIDRFSFQEASINARRRAFDRFVPEDPDQVLREIEEAKRKKAEAEAAATAAKLAAQKAAKEKAEAEAKAKAEAEAKEKEERRKKKRRGRITIYQESAPGGPVVAVDQTPEMPKTKPVKKKVKKKKNNPEPAPAPAAAPAEQQTSDSGSMLTQDAKARFDKMPDNRLKKELGKMLFQVQKNQNNATAASQSK